MPQVKKDKEEAELKAAWVLLNMFVIFEAEATARSLSNREWYIKSMTTYS